MNEIPSIDALRGNGAPEHAAPTATESSPRFQELLERLQRLAATQPKADDVDSPEQLREAIAVRLRPVADKHQVKIDLAPLFPSVPPFDQPADAELVRLAERLTGHAAEAVAFATEAPYLQQLGCETLVLGPGDIACAHQPDEYLDLDRIEPTVRLLRGMIEHYCLQSGRG